MYNDYNEEGEENGGYRNRRTDDGNLGRESYKRWGSWNMATNMKMEEMKVKANY